jgi:MFS family permease
MTAISDHDLWVRRSKRHAETVVAAAFAVMFVIFGGAYSFTAFFASLEAEFSAPRGALSQAFSLMLFLYYMVGAVTGPLANRFGARLMALIGTTTIGVGLLTSGVAQALWHVYIGYTLVGIGVGFAYVPSVGAVQRWFIARRGFVSGLVTSGIGFGTLVMPFAAATLITFVGWRYTWLALGLFTIAAGIAAALFVDDSPERHGIIPDGWVSNRTSASPAASMQSFTVGEALRMREFWLLHFGIQCVSVGLFVPFVHLVPYADDHGIAHEVSVALFSIVGVGSTLGRLAFGGVADKFGRRRSLTAMYLGIAVMFGWWLVSTSPWQLAVFALVFGAFYGGVVALLPALVSDYFGGRNASGIIGILYTAVAVGSLLGPRLTGDAYDYFQSYTLPIAICGVMAAVSVIFMSLLAEPGKRHPGGVQSGAGKTGSPS